MTATALRRGQANHIAPGRLVSQGIYNSSRLARRLPSSYGLLRSAHGI
jgi:hypothetical protein